MGEVESMLEVEPKAVLFPIQHGEDIGFFLLFNVFLLDVLEIYS